MDVRALGGKKTLWAWAVGTFFGAGLMKPGPGTYGSVAAALLWFGAMHLWQPIHAAWWTLAAALVATAVGIPAATIVARESGRDDPGHVVIDEVAGQLFALIAIPADWPHALVGLLLFRLFDITKPPPVRNLERLHGGVGIMLDDVAAGLLALGVGHLILLWR
ncbi:phosphatidylglycerophosphatase A [Granulicella sp. WH15]|uniref:phosphatidylglycerophosphatase A family protein n=1 Tax=Granulicella sp. WH15 TaxID=2602070 RepID=UPI00136782D1|nr:phosphatidylglycerophosphatase A [Granulicella sp. WH15]QHN05291.1 phosphatidylglycerophosphatase A [Granulicella sp. WH15]